MTCFIERTLVSLFIDEQSTAYPGASASVVESTVAQVIESAVNGVEGMIYMSSNSANDGTYALNVSFALTSPADAASALRAAGACAEPRSFGLCRFRTLFER